MPAFHVIRNGFERLETCASLSDAQKAMATYASEAQQILRSRYPSLQTTISESEHRMDVNATRSDQFVVQKEFFEIEESS
jgi:hypothetical protein